MGSKLDYSAFDRGGNGMSSVIRMKLGEDIGYVALDCLIGDEKFVRDFFVSITLSYQPEHVDLTRREIVLGCMFGQFHRDLRWNSLLPRVDGSDDLQQISMYLTL